jgi:phosphate/sulfate permease
MLRVLYDNFVLIVIAVAAATYVLIRLATLRRVPVSTDRVPGLATALIAGVISATIVAFGSLVLFPLGWLVNRDRLYDPVAGSGVCHSRTSGRWSPCP